MEFYNTHISGEAIELVGKTLESTWVSEGDVVTMRPEQEHGFQACTKRGFRYLNVALPMSTVEQLRFLYGEAMRDLWRAGDTPYRCKLSPAKTRVIQASINQLSVAPRERLEIDRFLLNLVHEVRQPASLEGAGEDMPAWLPAKPTSITGSRCPATN